MLPRESPKEICVNAGSEYYMALMPQIGLYTNRGILSIIYEMFTKKIDFYTCSVNEEKIVPEDCPPERKYIR